MMGYELNKEAELGLPHFFMMGLNNETDGIFYGSDVEFSDGFETIKERNSENMRVAVERIKEYGINGLIFHGIKKLLICFNDGTFHFGREGGAQFYLKILPEKDKIVSPFFRNVFYSTGKYYSINACIKQAAWIFVLFCCLLNIKTMIKNRKFSDEVSILVIAVLGYSLFELLFETRSRYTFSFAPIFIILSVNGIANILQNHFD